jgi:hypothetical protein
MRSLGLLLGLFALCACANTANNQPPDEVDRDREIARQAFLAHTESTVKSYDIKLLEKNERQIKFFIMGTGEFARPGFHWWVTVDRISGQTEIVNGE